MIFFYNDCATKIRDIFETQLGDSINLNYDNSAFRKKLSMREMLDLYLSARPWTKLNFYLILGLPSDAVATPQKQIFLPDYLKIAFKNATNSGKPLMGEDIIMYQPASITDKSTSIFDITFIIPAIILLFFCLSFRFRKFQFIWFTIVFFDGCVRFVFPVYVV